nr:MAG TPA: hypothetical protein [Caudoviricetes sp.]
MVSGLRPEIIYEGFLFLISSWTTETLNTRWVVVLGGSRTLKELPEFYNVICGRSILSYGVSSRSQPFTYNVILKLAVDPPISS